MLGIKTGPLQEQSVLLPAELFLQHHSHLKNFFKSHNNNEKYRNPLFQTKNSIIGCSLWQDFNTFEDNGCPNFIGLASATNADPQYEETPELFSYPTCNMLSLKLPPELNQSSDVESIVALLKGHFLRSSMLQISPLALHPGHKKRLFLLVYISSESLSSSSHKNKQASHCSCYRSSPRECLKAQGRSGSSPSSPASTPLLGEAHTAWLSGAVQSSAGFQTLYLQAFDGAETSWKAQV